MIGQTVDLQDKTFEIFLLEDEIEEAVSRLADQINRDYKGKSLVVIGVLDGAFMVLSDLLKQLKVSVSLELIKLKSYEGELSSGAIRKIIGVSAELKGKHVLVVEDIIDTGKTLEYILELLDGYHPASVKVATLLLKQEVFQNKFPIDYHGIVIPNKFVVGYGMDYNGLGRQLKDIYAAVES